MLGIIASISVFVICICACVLVFHPRIQMQSHINLIMLFLVLFGTALLVKDRFTPSAAGVFFLTCIATLLAEFTYHMITGKRWWIK